ncbi:hypothetical protein ABEB36_013318 [Hypothenemus hampei]|uniref:Uncharacterized protein n=1 Tax=Hypothenemus hampei TaxID=57062 RepID=A0ABD1E7L5_HYPHA
MEDLKNRFKMSPIYTVPDVPEYLLWDRAMALNEMFDWSDGKLHAQKPYRHQEMDPLNAKKFVTFQFLGPIRTTNFKMHPSWEKAKVVVRIWVAWTDYENEIISGKWHLLYELSYSKEKDSFGNYKECPELIK